MAAQVDEASNIRRLSLRQKERKSYADNFDIDDEDIYGKRNYLLHEKLTSEDVYTSHHVKEMRASDVTLGYFQEHGFSHPIVIKKKEGLGLRMPNSNFSVNDVKQCVGSRRMVDVMNVKTQRGEEMPMKDWAKYYETQERDRLLNVISLEFSHTALDNYVEQPEVVKQMDWVDLAWPQYLRDSQTDGTNKLDKMKYPKVQRYCLMSVAGCYTDFHIDMGGTSVWYHIVRGKKVFWLVPPTEENLRKYEEWTLTAKQGDVFFPDLVTDCQRITLEPGWTFLIPSGWIHGVYTPVDSLVFGGNFLHSFGMVMQLRIMEAEIKTRVPQKFRFPYFATMHWYVLERYVSSLLGRQHRVKSDEELAVEARLKRRMAQKNKRLPVVAAAELKEAVSPNAADVNGDEEDGESAEEDNSMMAESDDDGFGSSKTTNSGQQLAVQRERNTRVKPIVPDDDDENTSDAEERAATLKDCGVNGVYENLIISVRLERVDLSPNSKTKSELSSDGFRVRRLRQVSIVPQEVKKAEILKVNRISGTVSSVKKEERTSSVEEEETVTDKPYTHLTQFEIDGLRKIVAWLRSLPDNKRCIPTDIPHSDALLADVEVLLSQHQHDDPFLCVSGKPSIQCNNDVTLPPAAINSKTTMATAKPAVKLNSTNQSQQLVAASQPMNGNVSQSKAVRVLPLAAAGDAKARGTVHRYRRVRCRVCVPCQSEDCGLCSNCRDMIKYGGVGSRKHACLARQCINPLLPTIASCHLCGVSKATDNTGSASDDLVECHVCFKVTHMSCVEVPGGSINDDLRNSWLCPACCPGGQSTTSSDIKGLVQQCPERTSEAVNGVDKSASSSVNGKLKTTNGSNGVLSVPKRSNQDSDDSQSLLNKKIKTLVTNNYQPSPPVPASKVQTTTKAATPPVDDSDSQTPVRVRNVFDLFAS